MLLTISYIQFILYINVFIEVNSFQYTFFKKQENQSKVTLYDRHTCE